LTRLPYDAREIAIEIRQTASCFARKNRQLQERHVQGKPNLTRQAADERQAALRERERFAVSEHPQATFPGRDARSHRKLPFTAERGMLCDISSKPPVP